MPLTFTGMSCPWWALSVVNTYEISECEVVCRHMAHFMALRRLPTLYCSTMMAMHSLQKQCPQVSTAHYQSKTPSEYIHTNKVWQISLSSVYFTSWPSGRAQIGHGSGFRPPVDLSWDWINQYINYYIKCNSFVYLYMYYEYRVLKSTYHAKQDFSCSFKSLNILFKKVRFHNVK